MNLTVKSVLNGSENPHGILHTCSSWLQRFAAEFLIFVQVLSYDLSKSKNGKKFNYTSKRLLLNLGAKDKKKTCNTFFGKGIVNKCAKFGEDIPKRYRLKFGGVGVFSTFFSLPGNPDCACAKSGVIFNIFTGFRTKSKLTSYNRKWRKTASRGYCLERLELVEIGMGGDRNG